MVDKKITELNELTTPAAADVVAIVDDTAGTPATKKITYANLEANLSITASQVSDFDTEVSNNSSVTANTAKDTNVTTDLSLGTVTATTMDVNSSDGTNATLIEADTDDAGLLGADKFDEIVANTAKTGVTTQISNVVEDTTPQLGGDLDWNSNGTTLIGQTVGGSNGDAVYLSGSLTWSQADATAEATASDLLAIRVSASIVLTHGVYTTTGLTAGSIYYLSETTGAITITAPSTSTSIVRVIGYALSTTELFVNPDQTFVEVA